MEANLLIVAEMVKKLSTRTADAGLVPSAVEAFLTFCRRQKTRGRDLVRDLGLKSVLKEYFSSKGQEFEWESLVQGPVPGKFEKVRRGRKVLDTEKGGILGYGVISSEW